MPLRKYYREWLHSSITEKISQKFLWQQRLASKSQLSVFTIYIFVLILKAMSEYDIIDHILPKIIHVLSSHKDSDPVDPWLQALFAAMEFLPQQAISTFV
jgi:hypothetical protein